MYVEEMPLTKQYLRYVHQASFGVVSGRKSNAILVAARKGGGKANQPRIIAPAVEDIIIWDPRRGEKVILNKGKGCGFCYGRTEADSFNNKDYKFYGAWDGAISGNLLFLVLTGLEVLTSSA